MTCRHLQRNPDSQLYPLFEYFENWCQVRSLQPSAAVSHAVVDCELVQLCGA